MKRRIWFCLLLLFVNYFYLVCFLVLCGNYIFIMVRSSETPLVHMSADLLCLATVSPVITVSLCLKKAILWSLCVYIGMITRKHLSSTPIPPTSLICGKKRCCRTQRIRGKRRGSRRYKSFLQYFIDISCSISSFLARSLWHLFTCPPLLGAVVSNISHFCCPIESGGFIQPLKLHVLFEFKETTQPPCLPFVRSRGAVWMGHCRGRWRRSGRRGTVDKNGTWWLWIKSWGQTTDTPYTETEGLPLRAQCHQRTGRSLHLSNSF